MVTRFGSVSRAADALHLTQSAVSKQVKELEGWVGVPLFERSRKRLALMRAGPCCLRRWPCWSRPGA